MSGALAAAVSASELHRSHVRILRLAEIPRWISSKKVEIVRTLLSEDPVRAFTTRAVERMPRLTCCCSRILSAGDAVRFNSNSDVQAASRAVLTVLCRVARELRETLGISADGSEKVYRDDDITAFEEREAQRLVWVDRDHRYTLDHPPLKSRNCANSDRRVLPFQAQCDALLRRRRPFRRRCFGVLHLFSAY